MNGSPASPPHPGWHHHSGQARHYRRAAWWLCLGGLALPAGLAAMIGSGLRDGNLKAAALALFTGVLVCLALGIRSIVRGLRNRNPP